MQPYHINAVTMFQRKFRRKNPAIAMTVMPPQYSKSRFARSYESNIDAQTIKCALRG